MLTPEDVMRERWCVTEGGEASRSDIRCIASTPGRCYGSLLPMLLRSPSSCQALLRHAEPQALVVAVLKTLEPRYVAALMTHVVTMAMLLKGFRAAVAMGGHDEQVMRYLLGEAVSCPLPELLGGELSIMQVTARTGNIQVMRVCVEETDADINTVVGAKTAMDHAIDGFCRGSVSHEMLVLMRRHGAQRAGVLLEPVSPALALGSDLSGSVDSLIALSPSLSDCAA